MSGAAYWLPLFFAAAMGLAMLMYVILDGFDLGIGMLLPWVDEPTKDLMIAAIGPFWDANETWIVLGVGILLMAFPAAHGLVLTTLYIPVTLMLLGLVLRGIAFDFRVKAGDKHRARWNRAFFFGSLLAAVCQGWMLGEFITGFRGGVTGLAFSLLIALCLPALYIMLGSGWLLIKTDGELFRRPLLWARAAFLPMGAGLLLISIATPLVSPAIADKWFSLPNFFYLAVVPLLTAILFFRLWQVLFRRAETLKDKPRQVYVSLVGICVLATVGLGYSLFPDIVIGQLGLWEAAADAKSLMFAFWGTVCVVPAIFAYTFLIYRIFAGKATQLTYE
ncbi:MAG: cytochrome d ubiquinol oxidase subunit II [Gammaproteobacteria bacterium]|nr:cytochrome d ubiquinol oxidase subunit II [Gammaproteobacteria bacterium]